MPMLTSERIRRNELDFTYKVNVTKEGEFTTTLPKDIADIFLKAGIDLDRNRLQNLGYFCADTLDGLKDQIDTIVAEYFSKEEIKNKIVIRYAIETTCSYCFDTEENIVPNGNTYWTKSDKYSWLAGTTGHGSPTNQRPHGLQMFFAAHRKITYKYKSGVIKSEYLRLDEHEDMKKGSFLHWLHSIPTMTVPTNASVKEIDYTEEVAEFFVGMFISLCQLNEKIKNFLEPESILKIIENRVKLLG